MAGPSTVLRELARRIWVVSRGLAHGLAMAVRWTLRALALVLRRVLEVILALILLFEEWGWRPLADAIGRLRRFLAWQRLEAWIAGLPPYGALLVFALPTAILFPLKLAALWLIAHGHAVLAALVFVGAKVVGTAFLARIFMLTQPKLMTIRWFAWAYYKVMPWKEALFAAIRASAAWRYGRIVKARLKRRLAPAKDWARGVLAGLRWRMVEAWRDMKVALAPLRARVRAAPARVWARIRSLYSTNS